MKLHTVVAHRVVVRIAVGFAVPIVGVTHTVEAVATARIVMVVAAHRMTTVAGSGQCPSVSSRFACCSLTQSGSIISNPLEKCILGTPHYLSPRQGPPAGRLRPLLFSNTL